MGPLLGPPKQYGTLTKYDSKMDPNLENYPYRRTSIECTRLQQLGRNMMAAGFRLAVGIAVAVAVAVAAVVVVGSSSRRSK